MISGTGVTSSGIGIMGLLAYMQHARTTQTTEAAA